MAIEDDIQVKLLPCQSFWTWSMGSPSSPRAFQFSRPFVARDNCARATMKRTTQLRDVTAASSKREEGDLVAKLST